MREPLDEKPFTVREAEQRGWTSSALKHAVRRGRLIRVRRGVYAAARPVDAALRARAAALAHPTLVACDRSAALLSGMPLLGPSPPMPEVTVPPRSNANLAGLHPYRARLRDHEVHVLDGVLVTSPARTIGDLARHHTIGTAVVAADFALHHELTSAAELLDVAEFCRAWPGGLRIGRALALVDARSESPLESVSRLTMQRLGLPAPEPQTTILDLRGRFIGRCDFYWDEYGVIGEADGAGKYRELADLTDEKARHDALDDLNLAVVRWGWRAATREPSVLAARLNAGFERGRRRAQAGFPRLWTPTPAARDRWGGKLAGVS